MSLVVAVQMDPLDAINIAGDSTFALMLAAQARGHRLFHYAAEDLNYSDGRVWTKAHPVTVQRVVGDHFAFGDPVKLDLGERRMSC
jgi:glutathione synthase